MKRAAAVIAALVVLVLWSAPSAAVALPNPFCNPTAPLPDVPDTDLPGLFLDRPDRTLPGDGPADPETLVASGGFGGLGTMTYDLGCDVNPTNWADTIAAKSDAGLGGKMVSIAQSETALADAVDRKAWDGGWIVAFLGDFTDRAVSLVELRIVVPLIALGLIVASILLTNRARRGDVATVAAGVGWAVIVLAVGAAILSGPARLSTSAQSGASTFVTALYGGDSPALAATERTTTSVHYASWLRRTFGTDRSSTATEYGPRLLATKRLTWAEYDRTNPALAKNDAEREARLEARKTLIDAKAKEFNRLAAEIKDRDPQAYEHLQNVRGSSPVALVEVLFAGVAGFFRLAVALLLIMCLILLTFYGIAWLVLMPWLVTAPGQELGRGLLSATARALGYVLAAAVGSWLFSIWSEVALLPGLSTAWSVVLLLIGTVILWSLVRPDRKALALATMGRVRGNGRMTRRIITRVLAGSAAGYAAGKAFGAKAAEEHRESDEDRAERLAARHGGVPGNYMPPPEPKPKKIAHVPVTAAYAAPDARAVDTLPRRMPDFNALASATLERPAAPPLAPTTESVYQRPGTAPEPPAAGARGTDEDYYTSLPERRGAKTAETAKEWWTT